MNENTNSIKLIVGGILAVIAIAITLSSLTTIDVGERGVVVGFGKIKGVLTEGIHMVNPLYSVKTFNIRNNKYEATASSASSDIQKVGISVAVNYNINEQSVATLYATYGEDYINKVFLQNVQESIKSVSAQYPATDLITKRDDVKKLIKDKLSATVVDVITITDVAITNIDFSKSFDEAIEAKVTAEQNALASKNKLEQTKYEAEQRVTQAKGEAEAIKIQASAIQSQGGKEYVQLQAIAKWNGQLPITMAGVVPFVEIK